MANFIVVIDSDVHRRTNFIKQVKPKLSLVDGLSNSGCSLRSFCALWSADAKAPVSHVADDKGVAVVWGEPTSETVSGKIDAARLRDLWSSPLERVKAVFNGFYAAVVHSSSYELIAGADLLGIFPIYYWATDEVLLIGSSPELFRHHPAFRTEFNPAGLVGILLTMHTFDGKTLMRGVRRLAAGHILLWRHGTFPVELLQYKLSVSKKYFSLPFFAHVDILDKAVEDTIGRQVSARDSYALMLSGGLDSRILAGYLSQNDVNAVALTMGVSTDLEMRCAIPVARVLGLEHHKAELSFEHYPQYACRQAKWEHIANGFNFIMNWGLYPYLRNLGPRVVMGHSFDAVVGSSYIKWAYSPSQNAMSFEPYFANVNSWGIRPEILKRLLRREVFGDLVEQTIEHIRTFYESYGEFESQRAWCFNLYNRQRFHVGCAAWAFSFGAWPVLPVLDRNLLETAGAMPASTIADRRAEVELLCKRFPYLASLPLDRNSYNTGPLRPRLRYQLARHLYSRLRPLGSLFRSGKNGKAERRYYFRTYDFNSPGWLAVRCQAEPYRERLFNLFNRDVLEEVLPGPDVRLNFEDNIIECSGLKLLLGLMLWSKDHL